jgi:hypothetical protein
LFWIFGILRYISVIVICCVMVISLLASSQTKVSKQVDKKNRWNTRRLFTCTCISIPILQLFNSPKFLIQFLKNFRYNIFIQPTKKIKWIQTTIKRLFLIIFSFCETQLTVWLFWFLLCGNILQGSEPYTEIALSL